MSEREQSVTTTQHKLRKATNKEEYAKIWMSHFQKYEPRLNGTIKKKKEPTTEDLVSMLSGGLTLDDVVAKGY